MGTHLHCYPRDRQDLRGRSSGQAHARPQVEDCIVLLEIERMSEGKSWWTAEESNFQPTDQERRR